MFPHVGRPGTLEQITTALEAVIKFLAPFKDQRKWQDIKLFSDWVRGSTSGKPAQVTIDGLGRVELRGEARSGTGASTTVGHLPLGMRPPVNMTFPASAFNGARVFCSLDIQTNGRIVLIVPALAANVEVYLDGIRFDTRES